MDTIKRAYLQLHFAILLWGFTAILGDLIQLSAFWLVWWRVGLASLGLAMVPSIWSHIRVLSRSMLFKFFGIGVLIALHWLTFFGAIKYANASITLVALSTTAFFTSFIEPLFFRVRLRRLDVFFGIAVIPGMMLIASDLSGDMLLGFGVGLISAFLSALFAVLNKKMVDEVEPRTITFLELFSSWLFLTLMIPLVWSGSVEWIPARMDWVYLVVLAFICTNWAFTLHLRALKFISAFTANLIINLEPVYGIALAALILKDYQDVNPSFYLGVLMVIACVVAYPIVIKRQRRSTAAVGTG